MVICYELHMFCSVTERWAGNANGHLLSASHDAQFHAVCASASLAGSYMNPSSSEVFQPYETFDCSTFCEVLYVPCSTHTKKVSSVPFLFHNWVCHEHAAPSGDEWLHIDVNACKCLSLRYKINCMSFLIGHPVSRTNTFVGAFKTITNKTVFWSAATMVKGIVRHLGKYLYFISWELDERTDTTLMSMH